MFINENIVINNNVEKQWDFLKKKPLKIIINVITNNNS